MADTFGAAVQQLRQARGFSQRALAGRMFVSRSLVAQVELGNRPPTPEFAEACDTALGTTPLLATLAAIGDDMQRRSIIMRTLPTAIALGVVGHSPGGLTELLRAGLLDDAGIEHDWEALIADMRHRLTVDSSPKFGETLRARLMIAREQLAKSAGSPMMLAVTADLALIYGLWLGNVGSLAAADGMYSTARQLADKSGDRRLASHTYGRAASRGIYENWSVKQTMDHAQTALDLANGQPCPGALEGHVARATVYALTGEPTAGRASVAAMLSVAERSADSAALARTQFTNAYAEARYGTLDTARTAYDAAQESLAPRPIWKAEADVYLGRAMIAAGDVSGGARLALTAVEGLHDNVRVVGVAVRDAVAAAGRKSCPALDELRRYADPKPGPWETLR